MNNKILRAIAILTVLFSFKTTVMAGLSATPPNFASREELQSRNTTSVVTNQGESECFFTGRPFETSSQTILYTFRNFSLGESRWTVQDPSGYPDGANNYAYAPNPSSEVDFAGLLSLSGTYEPNPESHTVSYNGHNYKVTAWTAISIPAITFSLSGWTFINGGTIAGTLNFSTYAARDNGSLVGAEIEISASSLPTPANTYDWVQRVNTTMPLAGSPNPKFDSASPSTDPFYGGGKTTGANPTFYDYSKRDYATAFDRIASGASKMETWAGTLYVVNADYSAKTITVYDGIQWGWTISE